MAVPEAKIEVFAKDVSYTFGIAQHLYVLHTNSKGIQITYRGGPKHDQMHKDDLQITKIPFDQYHIDYPKTKDTIHPSAILARGSDEEIQKYVDKLWAKAEAINQEGFDYKLPTFGHVQKAILPWRLC